MNKIEKTAVRAALRSGRELIGRFKSFKRKTIKLKSHHEIITAADLASEKIIINEITKDFPDHEILSEEAGNNKKSSQYLWIIDPIDGTTNFSIHNPLWSISIGLALKKEIVLGLIYVPFMNELFIARKGAGARLNGRKIRVSGIGSNKAINTFCHSSKPSDIRKALEYHRKQKLEGLDCRQLGSAAIELAYVAAGRIESIMIPGANSWDVSAGALLVKEAGGRVTDFSGRKWSLKSRDILASNGKVHKNVLEVIN